MPERLSVVRSWFEREPETFRRETRHPCLVWPQAPPAGVKRPFTWGTLSGEVTADPATDDPLVLPLVKIDHPNNAFGVGITLGRTSNNDLQVDNESVSRFHAFFQQDPKSRIWHLIDAESLNGTFCEEMKLQAGRPAPLHDTASLRFGFVEMHFFLPEAFFALLGAPRATALRR